MKIWKKSLATLMMIWLLYIWVQILASEIFLEPAGGNLLMYCNQNIAVKVKNPDSPISSIDMVLTYDRNQLTGDDFTANLSEYNLATIFNEHVYNANIFSDTWRFGGTRLTDWTRNASTKHVWTFAFVNKSLVSGLSLWFHALPNTTAWDTNLSYQWTDRLDVVSGVWSGNYNFITGTCHIDNKSPVISNSFWTIQHNENRVESGRNIEFRAIDESSTLADYIFPSDNFGLNNYVINHSGIDNQYGVNSGTIEVLIQWYGYTDTYSLNGTNTFDSIVATGITRHRQDKWYDIVIHPIHDFRVEEQISIHFQARDNTHISKPTAILWQNSLIFNRPHAPYIVRNSLPWKLPSDSNNVDPEIEEILFRVQDDRAGVNSGSLSVEIRTWTSTAANWWLIKSYDKNELNLTSISLSTPNPNSITHNKNYDILLTWFGILPENSFIRVVVSGVDMAYLPNQFGTLWASDKFKFETRQSCSALQCHDGLNIFTWWLTGDYFKYVETWLYVTWWNDPFLSWNVLYCSDINYLSLDVLTNGTEIGLWSSTWWDLILDNFSGWNLTINAVWWTLELIWNTLYFTPNPACGDGNLDSWEQCDDGNNNNGDGCNSNCQTESSGWWGGGSWWWGGHSAHKDQCLLPDSVLPWANWDGLDYSISYFDRTCLGDETEFEYQEPVCSIDYEYMPELVSAYKYACELGITTMDTFEKANMKWIVLRKELAKMISEYAIKIVKKQPDKNIKCDFDDIQDESQELQSYMILSCQLSLMWLNSDGEPDIKFNPNGVVSKAEYATALSRLIRWNLYNTKIPSDRYKWHIQALQDANIVDFVWNPLEPEIRWMVMLMMKRTDKTNFISVQEFQNFDDSQNMCSVSPYGEELESSYLYSCRIGITTMPTIQEAAMYDEIIRSHMAKMISVYAIKVMKKIPDQSRICIFDDMDHESEEMQYFTKTSCQLWLMWLKYDGTPDTSFRPHEKVSRAIFTTLLSRLLFGDIYNGDADCWYCPHAKALNEHWIVHDIKDISSFELRGYVMLMLQRARDLAMQAIDK